MGFFRQLFGSDSSSDAQYNPSTYSSTMTTITQPTVSTDTTVSESEAPKEAELPDTAEYEAGEKRKRLRNGVRGTFTNPSGSSSDGSAIGS